MAMGICPWGDEVLMVIIALREKKEVEERERLLRL